MPLHGIQIQDVAGGHAIRRFWKPRATALLDEYAIAAASATTPASQEEPGREGMRALPRSSHQAYREAEYLRKKVKELELELQRAKEQGDHVVQLASHHSYESGTGGGITGPSERHSSIVWKGIYVNSARSAHATWFGPSSLFYFIGRLGAHIDDYVQQRPRRSADIVDVASKLLDAAILTAPVESDRGAEQLTKDFDLTSEQESYFLNLFWDSYHTIYPILDENEFKVHYQLLWTPGISRRRPSALVDIVLALCIQYGIALLPNSERDVASDGIMTDGYQHYRRCQLLLARETDNPTISTLQCQILSAVYFCCGSRTNMADGACSLAVRTSHMLGLHLDPPDSLSRPAQEMRRRMWWSLYVLESKMAMKLGRPFLLPHASDVMCRLPAHDQELASLSSLNFAPLTGGCTWLSWTWYHTKLVLAGRAAHTALYSHDPRSSGVAQGRENLSNPKSLQQSPTAWGDTLSFESSAEALTPHLQSLESWGKSVPEALTIKCKNGGSLLGTDMSNTVEALPDLQTERFAPVWLQRQRLHLQLMYHNLFVNICRPFISFVISPRSSPLADGMAVRCANHAIMLTHIMHQALCTTSSTSSIVAGWHEAFQWQWNAAITLIGYVRAVPSVKPTRTLSAARAAVDLAIAVLEAFGETLDVAVTVTDIVRELARSVDIRPDREVDVRTPASGAGLDIPPDLVPGAEQQRNESERSLAAMFESAMLSSASDMSKAEFQTAEGFESGKHDLYTLDMGQVDIDVAMQGNFDPTIDSTFGQSRVMLDDEIWSLMSSLGNDSHRPDGT
ncbi:Transcription factor [Moelleriella libera RCEF 2490]|uniref:Transcription factor n=1 Tax=Moelleriella libera RCEF 2490 TaxID=1081109 RepID=A0A167ZMY0_9HYPO|nr:Transcription factor [Moelleriella libera RCEF 2490]